MDRKWRLNRNAIHTVLSVPAFREKLHPWREDYDLCTITDLYAVYTVLHIEKKEWEIRWSEDGEFYFFVAKQTLPAAGEAAAAAVPEGDEDMPAPIGESEMADADQRREMTATTIDQDEDEGEGSSGEDEDEEEEAEDAGAAEAAAEEAGGSGDEPAAPEAAKTTGGPSIRTQIIIPVSSDYPKLTPALLQRFFSIRGVQAQQVILSMVDSNGTITRSSMFNYIQDPLEGPGTANVELLDD